MTLKTIKNGKKLVEITFDDVAQYDTNYCKETTPIECKAIGWLEEQNSSFVRIAWMKETKEEPYVGLAIPNGCVKTIQEIISNE